MSESDRLNAILAREAPALERMLSPIGRRAAFPQGIPWQATQARGAEINATIGQLTDGRGAPLQPAELSDAVHGLDPAMTWLYAPVDGPLSLRTAWIERQRRLAGNPAVATSLPVVSHGLTHSISLAASLLASDDTTILVPSPAWENYELLFGMVAAPKMATWRFFDDDGRLNVDGFARAIGAVEGKLVIVMNFPGNPSGYMPTAAEAAALVDVVVARRAPTAAIVDDAYQGWLYADDAHKRSLFWDLAEKADPEHLVVFKVDGATKEMLFFSSRVGFLTHTATGPGAEEAMLSKLKYVIRGTVGSASGPAMALIQRGLATRTLDTTFALRRGLLADRWRSLQSELDRAGIPYFPFNSAFFALLPLRDGLIAEDVRQRLLREHSVGVIAFPAENLIRLAYCSLHADDIPRLVERLAKVL